jgi:hypothetical protein
LRTANNSCVLTCVPSRKEPLADKALSHVLTNRDEYLANTVGRDCCCGRFSGGQDFPPITPQIKMLDVPAYVEHSQCRLR